MMDIEDHKIFVNKTNTPTDSKVFNVKEIEINGGGESSRDTSAENSAEKKSMKRLVKGSCQVCGIRDDPRTIFSCNTCGLSYHYSCQKQKQGGVIVQCLSCQKRTAEEAARRPSRRYLCTHVFDDNEREKQIQYKFNEIYSFFCHI